MITPTPAAAATPAIAGIALQAPNVIQPRRPRRKRRLRHARLCGVDRNRHRNRGPHAFDNRHQTADFLVRRHRVAPGRLDSAPMSIQSAPSAAICRACATAASTVVCRPPS
jgi:hypothetical protein